MKFFKVSCTSLLSNQELFSLLILVLLLISLNLIIILGPQRLVENYGFLGPSRTQERFSNGRILCLFMIFFFNIPNHNVFENRCFTFKKRL